MVKAGDKKYVLPAKSEYECARELDSGSKSQSNESQHLGVETLITAALLLCCSGDVHAPLLTDAEEMS